MADQDEPIRDDAQLVPVGAYRCDLMRKVVAFIRDDLGKGKIADRVEAAGRAGDLSPRVRPSLTSATHFNGAFVARTETGGHYEELRAHRSLSKDRRVFFDVSTDGAGWTVCLDDDVAEQLADYISPADPNWQPIATDVQDLLEGIAAGEVDGEEVEVRAEGILHRRNATVAPREMAQRIEARAREWSNTELFNQRTLLDVIEEVLRDGTPPKAYDLDRLVTRVRAIDPPEGSTVVLTVNQFPGTAVLREIAEDMKAAFPREALQAPFVLGRALSVVEAITIGRRATFDPAKFTRQRHDHNGLEPLHVWQARALVIALGPDGPSYEGAWSNAANDNENEIRRHEKWAAEQEADR